MTRESKPARTGKQTSEPTQIGHADQTLRDEELDGVTGGSSSVAQALKSIGEALSTAARKQ